MWEFHKIHGRYRAFRIRSVHMQQFLFPVFILVITDLIAVTPLSDRQAALGSLLKDQQPLAGKDSLRYVLCRLRFVFQFYNLIPNLNVEENIILPLLLDGKKMGNYRKQLDEILEIAGLSERRKHTPRELSGGQQQRVAIARALIGKPEILFADELTENLDSKTGAEIMSLLQKINQNSGQTIIMVTHSPEAAKRTSRLITVQDGIIQRADLQLSPEWGVSPGRQ